MTSSEQPAHCHCECGRNDFSVRGEPLMRAICHCQICQEFNQAPYADIVLYRREQVDFADDSAVAYRAYKQPPLVQRGKCTQCGKPVIEHLNAPLMPKLSLVPVTVHAHAESLPAPSLHMFYHRRVVDAPDSLPCYSGFLPSQWAFMRSLIGALRRSQ